MNFVEFFRAAIRWNFCELCLIFVQIVAHYISFSQYGQPKIKVVKSEENTSTVRECVENEAKSKELELGSVFFHYIMSN